MVANTATNVDSPFHRYADGAKLVLSTRFVFPRPYKRPPGRRRNGFWIHDLLLPSADDNVVWWPRLYKLEAARLHNFDAFGTNQISRFVLKAVRLESLFSTLLKAVFGLEFLQLLSGIWRFSQQSGHSPVRHITYQRDGTLERRGVKNPIPAFLFPGQFARSCPQPLTISHGV